MSAKAKTSFLFLFLIFNSLLLSNSNYKMSIEDITVLGTNKLEAKVYIENIGEDLVLTSYQCALSINQDIDLSSLSLIYVEGSSELLNEPNLFVGIDNIDGPTELTFVSYIGNDIISKKTAVGTFILEGNIDINNINLLDIQWDFDGTISTILTGKNFANITNPSSHVSIFGNSEQPSNVIKHDIHSVIASSTSDTTTSAYGTIDGKGYADGDITARWATQGMPASLIFDLNVQRQINKTRFSFFNFDKERIYQYSVRISDDKQNWIEVLSNVSSKEEEWSEENFEVIDGRYIELIFLSSTNNPGEWANLWEAEIWGIESANSVEDEEELAEIESVPSEYGISQNYPNPFNPSTKVRVKMKENGSARLDVYNVLGERVLAVLDQDLSAGTHEIDIDGSRLASGMYIYQLVVDNSFSDVKRMNLIK